MSETKPPTPDATIKHLAATIRRRIADDCDIFEGWEEQAAHQVERTLTGLIEGLLDAAIVEGSLAGWPVWSFGSTTYSTRDEARAAVLERYATAGETPAPQPPADTEKIDTLLHDLHRFADLNYDDCGLPLFDQYPREKLRQIVRDWLGSEGEPPKPVDTEPLAYAHRRIAELEAQLRRSEARTEAVSRLVEGWGEEEWDEEVQKP